jgi:hypothetical protein
MGYSFELILVILLRYVAAKNGVDNRKKPRAVAGTTDKVFDDLARHFWRNPKGQADFCE